ncbi:DUF1127 domain-containing protein [Tropicimonas sp. TH_r6]|uniref:DUF1127 domain-containing protein n=1 Tax=Tropicimonas sp. TH_r6 TaxID=3082085 RepID=UPI002954E054|nr:DUF1127 domain-containing protein [Tropicimonas sp. TH_r6]MDV7143342.1 DUF1127 domain-containing protein [Tropicimonas sp. TH_r6]
MSMNEAVFAPASLLDTPRRLVADFSVWRRQYAAYRNTMHELTKLDDRDLADLGMSRADFHYLAKQSAAKA